MDAKKIAKETPEEERIEKSEKYLLEAAQNQKKAAQKLNDELKNVDTTFENILNSVPREHYQEVYNVINQANKLLNEAKKGGDIESIINKLKNIK